MAPRIPYSVIEKAAVPAGLCGDLTSLQSLRCLLLSLTAVSDISNNLVVVECAQDSPNAGMSLVVLLFPLSTIAPLSDVPLGPPTFVVI
jgi:hypothetical protein